ncbi:hypothetical protein B0H16DRAFT_1883083 [Mycena metata]|uniref:Protein kinase domain-containing protein n=1 Tax=Mycena metata TaxID=1033252 RepID=A0AAD7JIL4_9AGAR|nr:hypothetical protein B0H16DRAFT_1883083 [Mycena metata]
MTVAKYEDEAERWQKDLEQYSNMRHPNVWQLFGISTTPAMKALIFHEEIIPLSIYREFYRPQSDLIWACTEAMLFKDCSQYHLWSTDGDTNVNCPD